MLKSVKMKSPRFDFTQDIHRGQALKAGGRQSPQSQSGKTKIESFSVDDHRPCIQSGSCQGWPCSEHPEFSVLEARLTL